MKTRNAFTMIELIFVIVIIGILGAVAIPKLNASRYDAKVARVLTNTKTLIQDIQTFYTSQGLNEYRTATIANITNVPMMTNSCRKHNTARIWMGTTMYICEDNIPVVKIETTNGGDVFQTVTLKDSSSDSGVLINELRRNSTYKYWTNSPSSTGRIYNLNEIKVKR